MPHFHPLGAYILKLCDYILECTVSFPCISFTRGLKRKVSVNDGIWAIPKIETTYVRRFKKIRTFPLHCESAVNQCAKKTNKDMEITIKYCSQCISNIERALEVELTGDHSLTMEVSIGRWRESTLAVGDWICTAYYIHKSSGWSAFSCRSRSPIIILHLLPPSSPRSKLKCEHLGL